MGVNGACQANALFMKRHGALLDLWPELNIAINLPELWLPLDACPGTTPGFLIAASTGLRFAALRLRGINFKALSFKVPTRPVAVVAQRLLEVKH